MATFQPVDILKGYRMYTPDFVEGMTPSSSECLKAGRMILEERRIQGNIELLELEIGWKKKAGSGTVNSAFIAAKTKTNSSDRLIDILEAMQNPPLARDGKPMGGKKLDCYHDYMKLVYGFNIDIADMQIFLHTAPCMFEPEDLHFDLGYFLDPHSYKGLRGGLEGHIRSYEHHLRRVPELGKGFRVQQVDMTVSVSPSDVIDLSYVAYNQNDKMHTVVRLQDHGFDICHYQAAFFTKKEHRKFNDVKVSLIRSTSTGDFVLRLETDETHPSFPGRLEIASKFYYKVLSQNSIFLGGNGFVHVLEQVRQNRDLVLEAVREKRRRIEYAKTHYGRT